MYQVTLAADLRSETENDGSEANLRDGTRRLALYKGLFKRTVVFQNIEGTYMWYFRTEFPHDSTLLDFVWPLIFTTKLQSRE